MTGDQLRRLVPQAILVIVAASVFLPWRRTPNLETLRGIDLGEGPLVLIAALASIALVQLGMRPAWMGPGFVVAVMARQVLGGVEPDELLYGAVVTLALAVLAAAILISAMFAKVDRASARPSAS